MSDKDLSHEQDLRGHTIAMAVDFHRTRIAVLDTEAAQHSHPAAEVVKSEDPKGYQHKVFLRDEYNDGSKRGDDESYWRALAHEVAPAQRILLLGHGTGKSNAAEHFKAFADKHFSDVAAKIVAIEKADIDDLTDNQLTRLGQQHFGLEPDRGGW